MVKYTVLVISCFLAWPLLAEPEQPFPGEVFQPAGETLQTLWLSAELKKQIKTLLDYHMPGIRLRYWRKGEKTAWVLDEVGKEQPITFGIVIDQNKIARVEVLDYRESRGGEIQFDYYRQQFIGAELMTKKTTFNPTSKPTLKLKLSNRIDGITGATLSVNASIKVAKVALFLHKYLSSSKQ